MSVSVKHLNADTTFLLTFSDVPALSRPGAAEQSSTFTVLVDPWLAGSSSIWMPRFQISHHTSESVYQSLADIPLPDLILISQDKPDHCHEATIRTLPRDSPVRILAVPSAAKKIKSWTHFDNAIIRTLPPYNPKNPETVHRIVLRSRDVLWGAPGEITISYIPQKLDMTNLHNAIGITYTAPTSAIVDKNGFPAFLPISPPLTPVHSSYSTPPTSVSISSDRSTAHSSVSSTSSTLFHAIFPVRPISILYTPHGIIPTALDPYIHTHLTSLGALPLTALFHSINTESNPWFLGGMVAPGFPGGSALVAKLGAKYWIGAHDEVKDNRGWSTAWLRSRGYTREEAQILLNDELDRASEADNRPRDKTRIVMLGVGEEMTTPP